MGRLKTYNGVLTFFLTLYTMYGEGKEERVLSCLIKLSVLRKGIKGIRLLSCQRKFTILKSLEHKKVDSKIYPSVCMHFFSLWRPTASARISLNDFFLITIATKHTFYFRFKGACRWGSSVSEVKKVVFQNKEERRNRKAIPTKKGSLLHKLSIFSFGRVLYKTSYICFYFQLQFSIVNTFKAE